MSRGTEGSLSSGQGYLAGLVVEHRLHEEADENLVDPLAWRTRAVFEL